MPPPWLSHISVHIFALFSSSSQSRQYWYACHNELLVRPSAKPPNPQIRIRPLEFFCVCSQRVLRYRHRLDRFLFLGYLYRAQLITAAGD